MATPAAAISRSILNPSQLHLKLYSNYTLFIPISAKDGDNVVNKSDVIRPHHNKRKGVPWTYDTPFLLFPLNIKPCFPLLGILRLA
mgnify:FL=1